MISYIFSYEGSERPKIIKRVLDSNGATVDTVLNFYNEEERKILTVEQTYNHIDNLVQYIKDKSQVISSIKMEEPIPSDGWHFNGGWAEIEWAKEEIFKWWQSVYFGETLEDGTY